MLCFKITSLVTFKLWLLASLPPPSPLSPGQSRQHQPAPGSEIVGSAELRKGKHGNKTGGNWEEQGRQLFACIFLLRLSPLQESLEQAKTTHTCLSLYCSRSLRKQLTFRDAIKGFTRKMTSEKRVQKFHTDDMPRGNLLQPITSTTQILERTRHNQEFLRSFLRRHAAGKPVVRWRCEMPFYGQVSRCLHPFMCAGEVSNLWEGSTPGHFDWLEICGVTVYAQWAKQLQNIFELQSEQPPTQTFFWLVT